MGNARQHPEACVGIEAAQPVMIEKWKPRYEAPTNDAAPTKVQALNGDFRGGVREALKGIAPDASEGHDGDIKPTTLVSHLHIHQLCKYTAKADYTSPDGKLVIHTGSEFEISLAKDQNSKDYLRIRLEKELSSHLIPYDELAKIAAIIA